MIAASALPGVLAELPTTQVEGRFWRVVKNEYMQGPPPGAPAGSPPQPLWAGGPAVTGGRYTRVKGPDCLYLATHPLTALAEVEAVLYDVEEGLVPGAKHDPLLLFECDVRAPAVLDLYDPEVQAALETSTNELTRSWLRGQARHKKGRGPLPPTQLLGEVAFASGVVLALRYPSRKHPGSVNLVVFTERLAALGGSVALWDKSGTLAQSLP